MNEKWQLISAEELQNQEKSLKSSSSNINNTTLASISKREREKLKVQLTPAQIYKIIVSKWYFLLFITDFFNLNIIFLTL
jgi:hypothetical protein